MFSNNGTILTDDAAVSIGLYLHRPPHGTRGEILLKHRIEQGLLQRELPERFGSDKATYANWEKDRRYPAMRHWPGIIKFLEFDPTPQPTTLGQRLFAHRRRYGLSRKALAISLGVDEGTLWRRETDDRAPTKAEHLQALRSVGLRCE